MRPIEYNNQTDEQLMKLYQNGDEVAFKELYVRHSSKIYGFVQSRVRNKEKVPEIYQEVFIKIHKSKSLYNNSLPLLPWIFTVTKSVLIDELRKDKNIIQVDSEILNNMPSSKEPSGPDLDTQSMISQLPNIQKQAIELRYMSEQTFEQIAESLNMKPSNVRQIISRGIKRLRELASDGGNNDSKK